MSLIRTTRAAISTFARTTAATYINALGVMANAAIDAPLINHDPVTKAALGVAIWPDRTNRIIGSADIGGVGWTLVNLPAPTPAAGVAPDGTTTMVKLVPSAVAGSHQTQRSVTLAAASHEVTSCFVQASGYTWARLVAFSPGMAGAYLSCDLTAGTYTLSGGATEGGIVLAAPTATPTWRIWMHYLTVTGGAGNQFVIVGSGGSFNFTGNTVDGILAWGMQQESGSFPSAYIPTTTLAVQRDEDNLTQTIADWFNAAEGTIFVECDWAYGSGADPGTRVALQIDDGTSNNRIRIDNNGGRRGDIRVTAGGVLSANIPGPAASAARTKIAFAWRSNDVAACIDGGAVTLQPGAAMPTGLTIARVGGGATTSLGGNVRWWYYPKRMIDADLMRMTA